jgi:hypothetical protein
MSAVAPTQVNLKKIQNFDEKSNLAIDQFNGICSGNISKDEDNFQTTVDKIYNIALMADFKAKQGDYTYLLRLLKANFNAKSIQQINSDNPDTKTKLSFIAEKVQHAADLNENFKSINEVPYQNYDTENLVKRVPLELVIPLEKKISDAFTRFDEITNLENPQDAIDQLINNPEIYQDLFSHLNNLNLNRSLNEEYTEVLQLNDIEINLLKINFILKELKNRNQGNLKEFLSLIINYYKHFKLLLSDYQKNNSYLIEENKAKKNGHSIDYVSDEI